MPISVRVRVYDNFVYRFAIYIYLCIIHTTHTHYLALRMFIRLASVICFLFAHFAHSLSAGLHCIGLAVCRIVAAVDKLLLIAAVAICCSHFNYLFIYTC